MKKLIYTTLVALAGIFAVSCQQEHIEVVYDPSNVTAQSLGEFTGVVLAADGDAITATFNPADFKLSVASGYTLYAADNANMDDKVKVAATLTIDENGIGHISIKQSAMNSLIYSLGGSADEPFSVYFQLEGGLQNDKSQTIAATAVQSNIVFAEFTPYSTIVKDVDLYPHVYPIGGIDLLGSWSHDKVFQFLYDYDKSGNTYTGLLDLSENHEGVQFKFTGEASWDNATGNWGVAADQAEEASEIQLENGSNDNIWQYGKNRFYFFSLNTESLVLTKKYSFDNVGIVGAFNGWNTADANLKMEYNVYLHRFYIDYEFSENTELKFACDDDWGLNWGGSDGTIAGGGDNIAVEAGSYRIYLDLNKGTYEFSGSMYGKEEPTGQEEPEPEPVVITGWNVIGLNGDWENDIIATQDGSKWSVYLTANEATTFKWRKDGDWAENYGGTFETSGEPFDAVAGGADIVLPAGFWKVVLDTDALTITITEGNIYSLIGEINGDSWTADIEMTESDGVWTSPVVNITGGFKIRHNLSWADENTYGVGEESATIGTAFTLAQPGGDIQLPAGDYKVQFTPETKEALITSVLYPETVYMIGKDFGGWDWSSDEVVELTPVLHNPSWGADAEAQFWTVRYFKGGSDHGFKFCSVRDWKGDFWGLTTNDGFVESGGNCTVEEDGFYLVHIDFKNEKVHIEPARIAIVGDCTGLGDDAWNTDAVEAVEANIFKTEGTELKLTLPKGGNLRMYAASAIATSPAWTREFNIYDGVIKYRGTGGDLDNVSVKAGQVVTLDPNAGTGSITGEGEGPTYQTQITVAGNYSGSKWSVADDPKLIGKGDGTYKGALVMQADGVEFKFVHDGSWIGGTADGLSFTLGADGNMTIPSGTYFWTVDLPNNTATAIEVTKVGLIGSFNEWATDAELTYSAEDYSYSGTVTLEEGAKLKVRFNASWDYALGGALDALDANGGDIVVAEAGTYNAKLELNKGTLTLTK